VANNVFGQELRFSRKTVFRFVWSAVTVPVIICFIATGFIVIFSWTRLITKTQKSHNG